MKMAPPVPPFHAAAVAAPPPPASFSVAWDEDVFYDADPFHHDTYTAEQFVRHQTGVPLTQSVTVRPSLSPGSSLRIRPRPAAAQVCSGRPLRAPLVDDAVSTPHPSHARIRGL